MKRLRLLAAAMVVALAVLAIWVAGTGTRPDGPAASNSATDTAYDYDARDVVVQQMGPDGTLQYELEARQIAQLPRNGLISARDLVMHYDPAGSPPGGPNRWTLTANRADLPESGAEITLQGKVRAEGLPQDSQSPIVVATERLTYNLDTQEIVSGTAVDLTWGGSSFHSGDLRLNIKRGTYAVESKLHGTIAH